MSFYLRDLLASGRLASANGLGVGVLAIDTPPALDVIEFLWASLALFDDDPLPADAVARYRPRLWICMWCHKRAPASFDGSESAAGCRVGSRRPAASDFPLPAGAWAEVSSRQISVSPPQGG